MKRFTETEKWREAWFRKLTAVQKCLWLYLQDNCDHAGVVELDLELASFQIGAKVRAEDAAALSRDLKNLPNGRIWLHGFVRAQYGKLSRDCKPHYPVFAALERNGVSVDEAQRLPEAHSEVMPRGIEAFRVGSENLQDKDEDKDKEEDKEGGGISPRSIYDAYPRKIAPQDAIRAIEKAIANPPLAAPSDFAQYLLGRTQAYAHAVAQWPEEERQYVPHPATWYNRGSYEDDPATWARRGDSGVHGKISSFA